MEKRSGVKNALAYKNVSTIRRIFPTFEHMNIIYPFLTKKEKIDLEFTEKRIELMKYLNILKKD